MLMVPDLFHWLMTGQKCNEFTEATTSQFYNPLKRDWALELLRKFDLPTPPYWGGSSSRVPTSVGCDPAWPTTAA